MKVRPIYIHISFHLKYGWSLQVRDAQYFPLLCGVEAAKIEQFLNENYIYSLEAVRSPTRCEVLYYVSHLTAAEHETRLRGAALLRREGERGCSP